MEIFGHNDTRDVWRSQGETFKPQNTLPDVSCLAANVTDALHKKDEIIKKHDNVLQNMQLHLRLVS